MSLPRHGQLYVYLVSAAGLLVVLYCLADLLTSPLDFEWLILAALTLLTGSFTIRVPSLAARISVSETFVFISVMLFGSSAGAITVALDALVASLGDQERPRRPLRATFNLAGGVISIWLASHAFSALVGSPTVSKQAFNLPALLLPLVVLAVVYFGVNSALIATAIAFENNQNPIAIWRKNFLWLSVSYFGAASVAALLVSYTRTVDLTALGIIIPVLIIYYLTFKTSVDRINDATRHVDEVSRLYLKTIETLATAIDAKDQVTHGHIRRVQKFALALAAELGITDDQQLKALEAAALLHDTGKLVVPEHILNKPGKLTVGEFEKMKRHASAGAEILSSIGFPYPVVPIVRHHHECWDGTGYPDGLRGTDIPIGARILAVVDCFDALTSDRPYRRSLTDDEAMKILMERRASMYDPLVVDVFAAVKDKLATTTPAISAVEAVLETRRSELLPTEATFELDGNNSEHHDLFTLLRELLRTTVDTTRAKVGVFFVRNPRRDELGSLACAFRRTTVDLTVTMSIGTRVSGWVAANGRPIINADAALDLEDEATKFSVSRCLCVPVTQGVHVLGVIALYTDDARGFSEQDLVFVEKALRTVDLKPLTEFVETFGSRHNHYSKRSAPTIH
jgi:putative nucleotidyltransferase with HDIG domain